MTRRMPRSGGVIGSRTSTTVRRSSGELPAPSRAISRAPVPSPSSTSTLTDVGVQAARAAGAPARPPARSARAGRRAPGGRAAASGPARPWSTPARASGGAGGAGVGRGPVLAGEREPDDVPAVGLVAGAPRRGQPLHERQAAPVAGGAPVALAGLGEVQLQRPGAAVGDGDGDLGVGDGEGHLELGAGVQHGVLAQLAGEQHGGVDEIQRRRRADRRRNRLHPPVRGARPAAFAALDRPNAASGGSRIRRSS